MKPRLRFRLVWVALVLVPVAVYASVFAFRSTPSPRSQPAPAIARASWGRFTTRGAEPCGPSARCSFRIVLGPLRDKTHVFLLETHWTGTEIGVQDHPPFDVIRALRYSWVAGCGLHVEGYGLDVQALSGTRCVPHSAKPGTSFWLHIANLLGRPRTVVITYFHDVVR